MSSPPPHMGEKPHSRLQEMLLFVTSWKIAWSGTFPSVSARTLESAFFPAFLTD